MQQWTPTRHVRAIGAWPVRVRRKGNPFVHRQQLASYSKDTVRTSIGGGQKTFSGKRPRKHSHKPPNRAERKRLAIPDDIPIPPFLRPDNYNNQLAELKQRRQTRSVPYDIYLGGNKRTRQRNQLYAPFSTAFAENPYAHALATPVREDRFSEARVPNSCLMDLHIADTEADDGAGEELREAKQTSSAAEKRKVKTSEARSEVSLLPVSMAAELVPKKKKNKSVDEEAALGSKRAENIPGAPSGSASYVLNSKRALDFIAGDTKRTKKLVVSRCMLQRAGNYKFKWRDDMGDFVLDALRRVVVKKAGWFFRTKVTADAPGSVVGMPGRAGRETLDRIDGVLCVLRLRPASNDSAELNNDEEDGQDMTRSHDAPEVTSAVHNDIDNSLHPDPTETRSLHDFPGTRGSDSPDISDFPTASDTVENPGPPQATSFDQVTLKRFLSESQDNDDDDPSDTQPLSIPNAAQQKRKRDGAWTEREDSFLKNINVPAPPPVPSSIYFPTLPYRNRRVTAYNLPYLLGEEMTAKLLEGSVFKDQELIAVTGNLGTVGLQVWLLKLAGFLAGPKGEVPRV